jgi:predicted amidophosphoribosyltransferase
MICTSCGRSIDPDMQFCPGCGRPAAAGPAVATQIAPAAAQRSAVCTKCGAELQESLAFCTACGTPQAARVATEPARAGAPPYPQPVMAYCVKCGATFDASSAFCTKCGTPRQSGAPIGANTEVRAKNALLLETIAGYFGFLGLGHIYGGRALVGILLMFGWWIGLTVITVIAATGIGLLIAVPAFFGIPYLSGKQARDYIRANRS